MSPTKHIGQMLSHSKPNERFQWVRMTIIYVVGVISGSLFHSVANPCIPLVGASGGIYALFGKSSSDPRFQILQ